jgi:tRNA G37 N-methylase Trm5
LSNGRTDAAVGRKVRGTADGLARLMRMIGLFALVIAAQEALPSAAAASFNPRAVELFERDWVLNQWARRQFDANGDGIISVTEAQPAALKFKEIADADADGRVTPYEYERAREFIIARY